MIPILLAREENFSESTIVLDGEQLDLIVPMTQELSERGLQSWPKLGPFEGMLFPSDKWPEPSEVRMWMANVTYPLCMVWLGAGEVVHVEHGRKPGDRKTYGKGVKALACIELRATTGKRLRIAKGMPWSWARD